MGIVAIVQARMGSSRLPGKILADLGGQPALRHVLDRLGSATRVESIVVATTRHRPDDAVEDFCKSFGYRCFRGSEEDVLDRYFQAARLSRASTIVRITADCPLLDPGVVDGLLGHFLANELDYCNTSAEFPDGLDCEALSMDALEAAWREASLPSEREHVTPFVKKHPERFRLGEYPCPEAWGRYRWTLDEEDDLRFLREVFARLQRPGRRIRTRDVVELLQREPHLFEINSRFQRNEGYRKSLEADRQSLVRAKRAAGPEDPEEGAADS